MPSLEKHVLQDGAWLLVRNVLSEHVDENLVFCH